MRGVPAERALERIFAGLGAPPDARARNEAWQAFAERGLPTTRDEDWRFTPLGSLEALELVAPGTETPPRAQLEAAFSRTGATRRIVTANGVRELCAGLALAAPRRAESLLDPKRSPFVALNSALHEEVVELEVVGNDAGPIHVVHWLGDGGAPHAVHPRLRVHVAAGARAVLVEHFVGAPGASGLLNACTELALERGAALDYVQLQELPPTAFCVASTALHQAEGSRASFAALALGARLARAQIEATLAGENAELLLHGLYLARGTQLSDLHTTIDHASPRTRSRELVKGILDERAHGVFHGRVHVRPHAQQIDAAQTNRTLLLSDRATIQSKPQLEIHADDVKCSHGATIGQLDPAQLFYLRSRGLGLDEARALLVQAFAAELVERLPLEPLRASLEAELRGWLAAGERR